MLRITPLGQKQPTYKIAILISYQSFNLEQIKRHYANPLINLGHSINDMVAVSLATNKQNRPTVSMVRKHMGTVVKTLSKWDISHLLVADSTYFKVLAKKTKAEPFYGYMLDSIYPEIKVALSVPYSQLYYKPELSKKLGMSLQAVHRDITGHAALFEDSILKNVAYPHTAKAFKNELNKLHTYPELGLDVETYSLELDLAGLASVALATSPSDGISTYIGRKPFTSYKDGLDQAWQAGSKLRYLKDFLIQYKGNLVFHNAPFDIKVLVWQLFMKHPMDIQGMLEGLDVLFSKMDDTKILAYLATNSTAGNALSLKELAFEHTGNYALEDIKDVSKVDPDNLMEYNLFDAAATLWVKDKYYNQVMKEQGRIYKHLFKPALKVITQMELVGMPIDMGTVLDTKTQLESIKDKHTQAIKNHTLIAGFNQILRAHAAVQANKKLKKLRKTSSDFADIEFNPGSPKQLRMLCFEFLKLSPLSKTRTNLNKTDGKTIKALRKQVQPGSEEDDLLMHIFELNKVDKITNTFIPGFMERSINKLEWYFFSGSFNLGGTVSGRLSSSGGLHQIPSTGTKYAKIIKSCFVAPPKNGNKGWLLIGADYSSLEDRVSALQTKDENKLKVYTDGYDGHCLRAHSYFNEQMPDIDPNDVNSINSIKQKYPDLRQKSKGPTFALQYMGTWRTLVDTFGIHVEEAELIEQNYHKLYAQADRWAATRVKEAQKKGYAELAFGLRLRAPLLKRIVIEADSMVPYQGHKTIKTLVNALGQSYGLLNTRAGNAFMARVWTSEWREKILPIAHIHDAQYYIIENDLDCLMWVNKHLIECMRWNKLPELQHPTVKLEAELEVYWPNWSKPIAIPNNINKTDLIDLVNKQKSAPPTEAKGTI